MLSDIIVFFIAVVSHWQGYVTGGAVTGLIGVVERLTDWKMPKRAYAAIFLGVFLLVSFFLTWREQYSQAKKVPSLQQQIFDQDKQIGDLKARPPQLQVNVPSPIVNIPPQMAYMSFVNSELLIPEYRIGGKWTFNITCRNISQSIVAEDAICLEQLQFVPTFTNSLGQAIVAKSNEDRLYEKFAKDAENLKVDHKTYGPGESNWGTVYSPLVDEGSDALFRKNGQTVMYLGRYSWRDGAGVHVNEICRWLEVYSGMFTGPGRLSPNTTVTWNSCHDHNGLKR